MSEFLLTNLPIVICVAVGLLLLIVEMFVPGFGLPGITGIIALFVGAVMIYIRSGLLASLEYMILAIALVAVALSITLKSASNGRLSKSPLILSDTERPQENQDAASDMSVFIDRVGLTRTVLRPSGIADFDGVRLNVVSDGTYIREGVAVRIERVEGSRIVVREVL